MDQALVEGHLRRALSAATSYERFEWSWKAFNVLYSVGAAEKDHEAFLFRSAARQLQAEAEGIFNHISLHPLMAIDPIFEEKCWQRAGEKNATRHLEVQRRLTQIGSRTPTGDDLVALVDLLNVIRCNLAHGFKDPDRPRDQEVLDAAAPILLAVVQALLAHQLKTSFRSA